MVVSDFFCTFVVEKGTTMKPRKFNKGMRCKYIGNLNIIKGVKMTIQDIIEPGSKTKDGKINKSDNPLYFAHLDKPLFGQYDYHYFGKDLSPIS